MGHQFQVPRAQHLRGALEGLRVVLDGTEGALVTRVLRPMTSSSAWCSFSEQERKDHEEKHVKVQKIMSCISQV